MNKLGGPKKILFATLAALAIVLAVNAPSQAAGMGGRGFEGGHRDGAVELRGFDEHRGSDGRFDRRGRGGFAFDFEPGVPYETPTYYWYCPSYGVYYPSVTTCPDAWVLVPAS